ncbi:MAG: 23S rRNA (pseudouridine(1915)-N(3))-methyltransferase RlmH [Clostridia bacterium]
MTIKILCVGRLKERFYTDAAAEFIKRLSRYAVVELVEVPDEKAPETLSAALRAQVISAEGARLLERIGESEYTVALAIEGKKMGSPQLASVLEGLMTDGKSRFTFVIGGSLGLSPQVMARADMALSFSDMTFSHQIFRIMLLEQLYRSFKIINNEPYHK